MTELCWYNRCDHGHLDWIENRVWSLVCGLNVWKIERKKKRIYNYQQQKACIIGHIPVTNTNLQFWGRGSRTCLQHLTSCTVIIKKQKKVRDRSAHMECIRKQAPQECNR